MLQRIEEKKMSKIKSFADLKSLVAKDSDLDWLAAAMRLPKNSMEFVLVRPDELLGDLTYQRQPTRRIKMINEIADNFDMRAFGFPHIVIRPSGEKYIIDGWGRIWARYKILGDNSPVLCINHKHIKSEEDEAKWFTILNKLVKKVNKNEIFKASVASGDEKANKLVKLATAGGAVINGSGKSGISSQAAEFLDHLGLLKEVAELKQLAWPHDRAGNPVWIAIGALIHATPKIDKIRLVNTLKSILPTRIMSKAEEKFGVWPHARVGSNRIASYLAVLYNYRLGDKHKIKPAWMRVNDVCLELPNRDRWDQCQIDIGNLRP